MDPGGRRRKLRRRANTSRRHRSRRRGATLHNHLANLASDVALGSAPWILAPRSAPPFSAPSPFYHRAKGAVNPFDRAARPPFTPPQPSPPPPLPSSLPAGAARRRPRSKAPGPGAVVVAPPPEPGTGAGRLPPRPRPRPRTRRRRPPAGTARPGPARPVLTMHDLIERGKC